MAKAIVIYESKYGNTKLVAEMIAEGVNHPAASCGMIHFPFGAALLLNLHQRQRCPPPPRPRPSGVSPGAEVETCIPGC